MLLGFGEFDWTSEFLWELFDRKLKKKVKIEEGIVRSVVTDSSIERRRCNCVAGLDCIVNIIRALRMGSCLSAESRSPLPGSPSASLGVRKRKNSKKRFGSSRSSSFEYRKDDHLSKIPGRLFYNGATELASLFTQQGKKGTNQDAMIVWEVSFLCSITLLCYFCYELLPPFWNTATIIDGIHHSKFILYFAANA